MLTVSAAHQFAVNRWNPSFTGRDSTPSTPNPATSSINRFSSSSPIASSPSPSQAATAGAASGGKSETAAAGGGPAATAVGGAASSSGGSVGQGRIMAAYSPPFSCNLTKKEHYHITINILKSKVIIIQIKQNTLFR